MPALQFEGKFVVIEIMSVTFDAVMTFKTTVAERHFMIHHESHIHGDMTFGASQDVECCDILAVTIRTQERFFFSDELVTL